jgi:hypothetical protein
MPRHAEWQALQIPRESGGPFQLLSALIGWMEKQREGQPLTGGCPKGEI